MKEEITKGCRDYLNADTIVEDRIHKWHTLGMCHAVIMMEPPDTPLFILATQVQTFLHAHTFGARLHAAKVARSISRKNWPNTHLTYLAR